MTLSSKHRIPFKPRRQGSSADLAGFSSRQGNRFIYTYDSMGRMLTRDDGTDLTTFTWDHWDCIKEVTGESETVYHIPEGQILSFIRDGERYELYADALGSCRMITDSEGEIAARYEYDAWGRAISVAEDSALVGFPNRFVGGEGVRLDHFSNLYYMRERWYDPSIRCFISRDPLGEAGGFNLYTYVGNQPLDEVDPFGLNPNRRRARPATRRGSMSEARRLEYNTNLHLAQARWMEWFGSRSFNIENYDLYTGVAKLYRQGFFFSPEGPLPRNLKTLRILRFERRGKCPGDSTYVYYDPGTPKRGSYPRDVRPHWKIRHQGRYYDRFGFEVEERSSAAHPRAGEPATGFPELLQENDPRLRRYKGPAFENVEPDNQHWILPYDGPEEI